MQADVVKASQRRPQLILETLIELDHMEMTDRRGEPLGEHTQTTADLEHDIVGASAARRSITPRMLRSARKFCPSSRWRAERTLTI